MSASKTAKSLEVETPSSGETDSKGNKLSNFLCFAVYSANLAFGRAYKPILDKLNLTYTQYIAMVALLREGRPDCQELSAKSSSWNRTR